MIVLCDASPLIFLAKLNRLHLIPQLLGPDVVVLQCVVNEVLGTAQVQHPEQQRLAAWLQSVRVVESIDTHVSKHRLRISVLLYQRFLAEFQPRDDHRGDCP